MGRKSRQARRAQERREAQRRKAQPVQRKGLNWSVLAGGAVVAAAIVALILFAVSQGNANKAAAEPPGKTISGIACDRGMTPGYHVHTHLDIYNKGKLDPVPPFVGFNIQHDCLYWLHTHQYSTYPQSMDMIHLEAPQKIVPTLGTFFKIWHQPLTSKQIYNVKIQPGEHVRVIVDGKNYTGNPKNITIVSHKNVTIEIGPPFAKPTPFNFVKFDREHPGNGF